MFIEILYEKSGLILEFIMGSLLKNFDEKMFQTDRHQRTHVYRPVNSCFDERYIQPKRRSGRVSIGIWGWISQDEPGGLSDLNNIKFIQVNKKSERHVEHV